MEGKRKFDKPKKSQFRQRAHCNPLADSVSIEYPLNPDYVDWSVHYPRFFNKEDDGALQLNTIEYPIKYPTKQDNTVNGRDSAKVEVLDVGCGFGGLLVALAPLLPDKLILGMEIRDKVTNYVGERIKQLRAEHADTGAYGNASVLRQNVMKNLVNYFRKGQLQKIFFCFPDPHFKRSNWRRRIVNESLLAQYAYVLAEGGLLYCVTDVRELYEWMRGSCLLHPAFEEIPIETLQNDPVVLAMRNETEESKKVKRAGMPNYAAVFRRKARAESTQQQ
eukprot:GDKI01031750.1.p1 GENE.GDKI01031750.1~~GDKI01031750.1.p1  ORF type:complete len:277 (-),score=79.59 GDKI01031750.1:133-963(-)